MTTRCRKACILKHLIQRLANALPRCVLTLRYFLISFLISFPITVESLQRSKRLKTSGSRIGARAITLRHNFTERSALVSTSLLKFCHRPSRVYPSFSRQHLKRLIWGPAKREGSPESAPDMSSRRICSKHELLQKSSHNRLPCHLSRKVSHDIESQADLNHVLRMHPVYYL